jgi:hypothetical protein
VIIEVAGWSHYRYVACKILTSIGIGAMHRVDAERGASLKPTGFGCGARLLGYLCCAVPLDSRYIACKHERPVPRPP